jgi:hypothetical protein
MTSSSVLIGDSAKRVSVILKKVGSTSGTIIAMPKIVDIY